MLPICLPAAVRRFRHVRVMLDQGSAVTVEGATMGATCYSYDLSDTAYDISYQRREPHDEERIGHATCKMLPTAEYSCVDYDTIALKSLLGA